jgi:hypothetical protein
MARFFYDTTVEVNVTIDEDDLSDEDLIGIFRSRKLSALDGSDLDDKITEMFYAFRLGQDSRAIELAKQIAQDHTGRIL